MDKIKDMIANIAAGDMATAKEQVNDMLAQRIVAGMDERKIEIAQNLFTAPEQTTEEFIPEAAKIPGAACPRCGGWTSMGGMSQFANSTKEVHGRKGCSCNNKKTSKDSEKNKK